MASTPEVATSLLQVALVIGIVLVGQIVAVRHLPVDMVPGVLQSRIAMCSRVRPWLFGGVAAMFVAGVVLSLA